MPSRPLDSNVPDLAYMRALLALARLRTRLAKMRSLPFETGQQMAKELSAIVLQLRRTGAEWIADDVTAALAKLRTTNHVLSQDQQWRQQAAMQASSVLKHLGQGSIERPGEGRSQGDRKVTVA